MNRTGGDIQTAGNLQLTQHSPSGNQKSLLFLYLCLYIHISTCVFYHTCLTIKPQQQLKLEMVPIQLCNFDRYLLSKWLNCQG